MARITISYRRDDSGVIAGRIFDRLKDHYGADSVFRDIDNIPPGIDYRKYINAALESTDVLLAIVGPQWAGSTPDGRPRLQLPTDFVRLEVGAALRKDIPVIPVLVGNAAMPQPEALPDELQDFAFRNAVKVDALEDFDDHIRRLIRSMDRLLEAKIPPPATEVPSRPRQEEPATEAKAQATSRDPALVPVWLASSAATKVAPETLSHKHEERVPAPAPSLTPQSLFSPDLALLFAAAGLSFAGALWGAVAIMNHRIDFVVLSVALLGLIACLAAFGTIRGLWIARPVAVLLFVLGTGIFGYVSTWYSGREEFRAFSWAVLAINSLTGALICIIWWPKVGDATTSVFRPRPGDVALAIWFLGLPVLLNYNMRAGPQVLVACLVVICLLGYAIYSRRASKAG